MAVLTGDSLTGALASLHSDWKPVQVDGCDALQRQWGFKDFSSAFALATRIALLSEANDHHPLIEVAWGSLSVSWWTHSEGGVTQADIAMAAKCDKF